MFIDHFFDSNPAPLTPTSPAPPTPPARPAPPTPPARPTRPAPPTPPAHPPFPTSLSSLHYPIQEISESEIAITVIFNNICRDLKANQSSLLNLQSLCILSRVNKFLFLQIFKTWQARLYALTKSASVIHVIQKTTLAPLNRIWFQLQRFNFSLDSMSKDHTLLIQATSANCPELVELLLAALKVENHNGANAQYSDITKTWKTTLLINSATRGQKEIVKILLNAKADLEIRNSKQQTALMSVVYALINPAAVAPSKKTFYGMAKYTQHWFDRQKERVKDRKFCMQALIDAKANVNVLNHANVTPLLMEVSATGRYDIMCALIEARANLHTRSLNGHTALMHAAHHKHTTATKVLLDAKADVNMFNRAGNTALIKAAQCGRSETVHMLISAHAQIDHADTEGSTAFMHAAYRGNLMAMQVLISAKANIHMYNKQGDTSLTYAAKHGNLGVVRMLIAARADVRRCTANGNTPIKLAISHRHMEIAGLLYFRAHEDLEIQEIQDDLFDSDDDQDPCPQNCT